MRKEHWKPWKAEPHSEMPDVLVIPIHGWVNRKRAIVAQALIDQDALLLIRDCYWQLHGKTKKYARGNMDGHSLFMHRVILGVTDSHIHVDHINHDVLDNRRINLRAGTVQQNAFNKQPKATSSFKGVSYCRRTNRWAAGIMFNGKSRFLGRHDTAEIAAAAYDAAARELFGEHAWLNFPGQAERVGL